MNGGGKWLGWKRLKAKSLSRCLGSLQNFHQFSLILSHLLSYRHQRLLIKHCSNRDIEYIDILLLLAIFTEKASHSPVIKSKICSQQKRVECQQLIYSFFKEKFQLKCADPIYCKNSISTFYYITFSLGLVYLQVPLFIYTGHKLETAFRKLKVSIQLKYS